MHDLTADLNTYHHGVVRSKLDRILGPEFFPSHQLLYQISKEVRWVKAGHDTIEVSFSAQAATEVSPPTPFPYDYSHLCF